MVYAHCMLEKNKATDTRKICNIYCSTTSTMVARKYLNVTLYVHCLSWTWHRMASPILTWVFERSWRLIFMTEKVSDVMKKEETGSTEHWYLFDEWKTNLMSLVILFHLLCAQHVSDINISIFRSLRRTENKTTDVVIHQHSRKLLKMDILMSETCWAHKSEIK